jgi:hypothetical protein
VSGTPEAPPQDCRRTRVRFIWPDDGSLGETEGTVIHVSGPGALVRWDSGQQGWYADASWLAGPDGKPLEAAS